MLAAFGSVTRNSADTGAQVEVLAAQLSAQEGTIAELRSELERLQAERGKVAEELGDLERF